MRLVPGFFLYFLALPAAAAPVYLACSTTFRSDPPKSFSVTIDEASGKVTHQHANGTTFNADGLFTATEVSYQAVSCSSFCMTQQFTINRVDLSVASSITISSSGIAGRAPLLASGTCSMQAAPERQF